jgi:hypothetical protein
LALISCPAPKQEIDRAACGGLPIIGLSVPLYSFFVWTPPAIVAGGTVWIGWADLGA